ncbi:MAG: hypothetical protein WAM28_04035 [Chlamydiales bacterium]
MSAPIPDSSVPTQTVFRYELEEINDDNSRSNSSVNNHLSEEQQAVATLRRKLEAKDEVIKQLSQAIERTTKDKLSIEEERIDLLRLEEELGILRNKNRRLLERIRQYEQVQGQSVSDLRSQSAEEMSILETADANSTQTLRCVMRGLRRHRKLVHSLICFGGVVATYFFLPFAIPIFLCTTGFNGLFEWIINGSD